MRPEKYPGTYLSNKFFEERYKIVADFLKDKIENPIVVDLNCGEPLFSKHIKFKEYYANDLYKPEFKENINFRQISDELVDIKPDLLCMFGCSAGELTNNDLESKTATNSLFRLAEYKPEFIVIESSTEWEKRYNYLTMIKEKLSNYIVVFEKNLEIEPKEHYHDFRKIIIFKLKK